jgi:hypothetical protein
MGYYVSRGSVTEAVTRGKVALKSFQDWVLNFSSFWGTRSVPAREKSSFHSSSVLAQKVPNFLWELALYLFTVWITTEKILRLYHCP